ncbi:MAG: preprotein translocase subunit SecA [Candidatus Cloacimonetes bacterium]|nr:preprotein translocase subunit SecA [Candidatus Cloacimonadota bacterium]MDD3501069.1 preprotein translocase subunit SecA [Candidatus Cloacimonadota bacterium]
MIEKIIKFFFGDRKEKELKKVLPIIEAINREFEQLNTLNNEELKEKVNDIREEIQQALKPLEIELERLRKEYQETADEKDKNAISNTIDEKAKYLKEFTQSILDDNLIDVFAIVKETCRRLVGHKYNVRGHEVVWDMVPFDVQLIGGIALHQGNIAEMATGEGKTLVATLPLFLNALTGRGVHLVTVNDYLVQRDAEWMSPIFDFHDISVGTIANNMPSNLRKEAYECDITYGTNSEFGFDYLRDNMAVSSEQLVQRNHFFAIIDEADSVLIDEARTPLIISGPVADSKNYYTDINPIIKKLVYMQNQFVQRLMSEIRALQNKESFSSEDSNELGRKLLLVKRGAPKNKAFIKLMKEPDLKKLVQDYEGWMLRDKTMHEIDEELFYSIEEANHSADLCEKGQNELSKLFPNLFVVEHLDEALSNIEQNEELSQEEKARQKERKTSEYIQKSEYLHNISQLIKAYALFEKDVEYVVVDNKVMIVDEFTGRMMPGRRFSDGLHQALEAKENVTIEDATQTYATITLQNFFRMYDKLSGMTGTAITEESEFHEIYKMSVKVIPTNEQITRLDYDDLIYLTKNEKYSAIIDEIEYWHKQNKPVLVGTITVEVSEILSRLLKRKNIAHNVLNAKYHEKEAEIVALAGQPGAVTIATNMAGRGTDIKLGKSVITQIKENYHGLPKIVSEEIPFGQPIDGLHIIGTERHESRRIDMQLRGRAGRQGDPGTSRFYLSLEDDLMRLFGSDRITGLLQRAGLKSGEAITHPWMTNAVEKAQKRVEEQNFEIRKQLIKYDEVMNQQREVIYTYRRNVLKGYDLKLDIEDMIKNSMEKLVLTHTEGIPYSEDWPLDRIRNWLAVQLNIKIAQDEFNLPRLSQELLYDVICEFALKEYEAREKMLGIDTMREIERRSLLEVVDNEWRDHLHEMDILREGISFRAYANKDPLIEYKTESFKLFEELIVRIHDQTVRRVYNSYIVTQENIKNLLDNAILKHDDISAYQRATSGAENKAEPAKVQPVKNLDKVGRNDPCPCGSGLKYKKCCGKMESFNDSNN